MIPPPPIPQDASYSRQNARWVRKMAREQRRASAAATRQQRLAQRIEARRNRRYSMLGPLLLILFGTVLLLVEVDALAWDHVVAWLARWWPLMLVGAGLALVGEWLIDTQQFRVQAAPLPRRTLGASGVLMLTGLVIAGPVTAAVLHSAAWADDHWNAADTWGLRETFAKRSDTVQQLEAPLGVGQRLTVQNARGSISVTGSSQDGKVHVSARQRLWAWDSSELEARKRQDQPTLLSTSSGLVLQVAGAERDQTDLTIEVPHEASMEIGPEEGELSLSELRGDVKVSEHRGNILLTALSGRIQLSSQDDDADITGHSLTGELTFTGRSGDLSFSDIRGPVNLRGDFFGSTHLERVDGPVHFKSSFTDFSCAGAPGEVHVEGRSEFEGSHLIGPVVLRTTDREITLSDIQKGASVTNRKGSVTLSMVDPLSPVQVTTTDGDINLRVPDSSSFHVGAETADGQIESDFGLKPQHVGDRASLSAQVRSGGPLLQLRTTEGDVHLRKVSAENAAQSSEAEEKDDDD